MESTLAYLHASFHFAAERADTRQRTDRDSMKVDSVQELPTVLKAPLPVDEKGARGDFLKVGI